MNLDKLPRMHPSHPFKVYLYYRKKLVSTIYVRAASDARAKVMGAYWTNAIRSKSKKIKIDSASARPCMPIRANSYWDFVNLSNPTGLKLADYHECTQDDMFDDIETDLS